MRLKKGDTFIEVLFAVTVFSLVAILSFVVMNSGVQSAQASLEVTMARNEIDAQAEALRFIHNSFLSEREFVDDQQVYRNLWKRLTNPSTSGGLGNRSNDVPDLTYAKCNEPYDSTKPKSIAALHGFIINTRNINPGEPNNTIITQSSAKFQESSLYPRIIYSFDGTFGPGSNNSDNSNLSEGYTNLAAGSGYSVSTGQAYRKVAQVEGIWIISIAADTGANNVYSDVPEYYDFHIRTCWLSPGSNSPSTIGTIIRLYNPELVEINR